MRILVTGPRIWTDKWLVQEAFQEVNFVRAFYNDETVPTLIHGGAGGLDTLAAAEARRRGWHLELHRPRYDLYPPYAAPMRRNQEMVDSGAYLCLAFLMECPLRNCRKPKPHYTHGTADCMQRAKDAGIPIWKYQA